MKIISYESIENLKRFTSSMLLDSGTTIAEIRCEEGNKKICVKLVVNGPVKVEYLEKIYETPSEFPSGLIKLIKEEPYWTCHKDIYVFKHNWFEYIFEEDGVNWFNGAVAENNLHLLTPASLKMKMYNYCKLLIE